jgi:hypothetical protein
MSKQTVEVPFEMIELLSKMTSQAITEFDNFSGKIDDNFDEHVRSHSRQRSKNKVIKRRLKDMQNKSVEQADQ